MFINKVRTRPIINLNILDLIKLIEKSIVLCLIEYVCSHNDDNIAHKIVSVPCSGADSTHTACIPHQTELCTGPPLPTGPGPAKRITQEHDTERSH